MSAAMRRQRSAVIAHSDPFHRRLLAEATAGLGLEPYVYDNGAEALADASFAALQAVCLRLAKAYERLILARKRQLLTGVAPTAEREVPVREGAAAWFPKPAHR